MKKRNLKKGVAIELALLVLIIVTFASALILSLAVISTKQKNNENALFNHKVYLEEITEDIIWKRFGDKESSISCGNIECTFKGIDQNVNDYVLVIIENKVEYKVKFQSAGSEGEGENKIDFYTLKISQKADDLLTVELKMRHNDIYNPSKAEITIISWQY